MSKPTIEFIFSGLPCVDNELLLVKYISGNRNFIYLLSQSFPLKPSQIHLYPPGIGMQVPPFLQGFGSQYFRSGKMEKMKIAHG